MGEIHFHALARLIVQPQKELRAGKVLRRGLSEQLRCPAPVLGNAVAVAAQHAQIALGFGTAQSGGFLIKLRRLLDVLLHAPSGLVAQPQLAEAAGMSRFRAPPEAVGGALVVSFKAMAVGVAQPQAVKPVGIVLLGGSAEAHGGFLRRFLHALAVVIAQP